MASLLVPWGTADLSPNSWTGWLGVLPAGPKPALGPSASPPPPGEQLAPVRLTATPFLQNSASSLASMTVC